MIAPSTGPISAKSRAVAASGAGPNSVWANLRAAKADLRKSALSFGVVIFASCLCAEIFIQHDHKVVQGRKDVCARP